MKKLCSKKIISARPQKISCQMFLQKMVALLVFLKVSKSIKNVFYSF